MPTAPAPYQSRIAELGKPEARYEEPPVNALPAAVLSSFFLSTSHMFATVGATSDVFATPDGAISFKDRSYLLDLPGIGGKRVPYRGETWSLTWGDANNNKWPDLYLNHHNHPGSHLIFDLGVYGVDWSYVQLDQYRNWEIYVVPSDQHNAVFADVDGDGKEDIYETVGGKSGAAKVTDELTKNNLFLAGVEGFTPNSTADDFGLSYTAARGRMAIPINLKNNLALLVTNLPREDRLFPTSIFVRGANGMFVEDPDVFKSRSCWLLFCSTENAADLHGYSLAVTGHLDSDDNLDVLFAQGRGSPKSVVFWGRESTGDFLSNLDPVLDKYVRDLAVVDTDNDGRFEVWFAGIAGGRNSLLSCCRHGNLVERRLAKSAENNKTVGVVTGDFDNDTDVDVVTYEESNEDAFTFSIWENDGTGMFERHQFEERGNPGRARNVAVADYNLDGAQDLVFSDGRAYPFSEQPDGGYMLLEGQPSGNNWLEIDLRDPHGLRGLGARVEVTAGDTTMWRGQYGGVHSDAQDFKRLHFGLGKHTKVDVSVKWNDGSVTELDGVTPNQVIVINQR